MYAHVPINAQQGHNVQLQSILNIPESFQFLLKLYAEKITEIAM